MKRLVAAGAAAAVAVVAIPTLAGARTGQAKKPQVAKNVGWVACREHPILHISPPLTFGAPHPATVTISDVIESCTSSDPTIDRGIAYINAKSPGASCMSGTVAGVARIRWNNGRTSLVDFNAAFAAGFARTASGHVAAGSEFVGRSFTALDHLNIDQIAIQLCGTPSVGLSTLASDGELAIGAPPTVGGVVWKP